jgi:Asp-tRNA(Asn)/Glu-tRNA(Gln) amidotransferase A subunit family amidase
MLSALALARRVDAGELTPEGVVDLCAAAINAREAEIGAFASLDIAAARKRAAGLAATPLRGLPVGLKDIIDTADLPTAYGSALYAGHQPKSDAALTSMVRRAGGVVLGKTVTTELAHMHPGKTRNPHDGAHTPGGSSSGSAAAVAAGFLPIAIGTQTGGSVIRPASYCGVAAIKPSFKLLPTVGIKCFSWSLDTPGIFAASVADVAFAIAAITGRDLDVDSGSAAPPRLALVRTHAWRDASEAMQQAVEAAASTAAAAGASVDELVLPPLFEDAFQAQAIIQDYEAFRAFAWEYDHHRDGLPAPLRVLLDKAAGISAETYDAARRTARRARNGFADLMADLDALIGAAAPGAAPKGLDTTGVPTFNRLWTLLGAPCVNVPGRTDTAGLPLGVQVIGRFGRDRRALEAALFVERALAGAGRT